MAADLLNGSVPPSSGDGVNGDLKTCCRCREHKPLDAFHRASAKRDGRRSHCKECHALWYREERAGQAIHKEYQRAAHLSYRYNLSTERYDEMLADQNGACVICLEPGQLHVDHDHACCPGDRSCGECIRGLLCGSCNRAEGLLHSDPERIRRLLAFMEGQVDG